MPSKYYRSRRPGLSPDVATPLAQAYSQEAQAAQQVDQAAREQDTVRQIEDDLRQKKATEEKFNLGLAKRQGALTQADPATGKEVVQRDETGNPVYEAGFLGGPKVSNEGKPVVEYRDPRGKVNPVPLDGIQRVDDPTGETFYEFNLDGQKVRRPEEKANPLFKIDPATGKRFTETQDPTTGAIVPQPLGIDPKAANVAAINRRKAEYAKQTEARKFQADELRLQQQVFENEYKPIKEQLSEAEKAAKDYADPEAETERYEQRQDGLYRIEKAGRSTALPIKLDPSDPASIASGQNWLRNKKQAEERVAQLKAEHDPRAAQLAEMQAKRDRLALEALRESNRVQTELSDMEEADKAGLQLYKPEWRKKLDASRKDARYQQIVAAGDFADSGSDLADDISRVDMPSPDGKPAPLSIAQRIFKDLSDAPRTNYVQTDAPVDLAKIADRTNERSILDVLTSGLTAGKDTLESKRVFPTNHPRVKNGDGGQSNVVIGGFNIGGREYNIPTMVDGKQLTEDEAVAIARKNGLDKYPSFATAKEASAWAEKNHGNIDEQGRLIDDSVTRQARELAVKSLGVTDPEAYSVTQAENGGFNLFRAGSDTPIGRLDPNAKQILVFPSEAVTEAGQELLTKATKDGFPVYRMGGGTPMTAQELRDYVAKGVSIARTAQTPDQKDAALAQEGITPADVRERVFSGRMSVQDGKWLQEKLFETQEVDNSAEGYAKGFTDYLAKNPAQASLLAKGKPEDKAAVVNKYADLRVSQSADNLFLSRTDQATRRGELLQRHAGKGWIGKTDSFVRNTLIPMAGLFAQGGLMVTGAPTIMSTLGHKPKWLGLAEENTRDFLYRAPKYVNRINEREGVVFAVDELRAWADRARPGEQPPEELTAKIAKEVYSGYHELTPEEAKSRDTTEDTFNINKDKALSAMMQRYLSSGNDADLSGMVSMLAMDAKDRKTQAAIAAYTEAPRAATPDVVMERMKPLGLKLDPKAAADLLAIRRAVDSAKDKATASAAMAKAQKILGTSTPEDTALAFDTLTVLETDDPDSVKALFKGGLSAGFQEVGTEVLSTTVEVAVAFATGGGATPAILAERAASTAAKGGVRAAFKRMAAASLDAASEYSTTFAKTRNALSRGRARLGAEIAKESDKFTKAGMLTEKFGQPLTAAQKARNLGVATLKIAAAGAPIEALEEGVASLGEADATLGSTFEQMAMGAAGAGLITPIFSGMTAVSNVFRNRRAGRAYEQEKVKFVEKFNERMAKTPGFKPITPADFDTWQAIQSNPSHQAAVSEYAAAVAERDALTEQVDATPANGMVSDAQGNRTTDARPIDQQSTQDISLGENGTATGKTQNGTDATANAGVGEPEVKPAALIAAEAKVEAAAQNLAALSEVAFGVADELRAIPEAERPLYTGAAKAAAGATDFTADEAKALIKQSGANAVAFQQAQTLPAGVQGPQQLKTLADLPEVSTVAPSVYRLPAGVSISLPPALLDTLRQAAPSMVDLLAVNQSMPVDLVGADVQQKVKPAPKVPVKGSKQAKVTNPAGLEQLARRVIGEVVAKSPKIKELVKEAKKDLSYPNGGMWMNANGTISYYLPTLLTELNGLDETTAAKRVAALLDEEIRHAANMEASKRVFESEKNAPGNLQGISYPVWRDAWYSDIWDNHFTEEMRAKVREAYGDTLPPDKWMQAMEGLRMLDQLRATGSITEAVLRHLEAVIQALREFLTNATPTVKREIANIQAVLQEYGYEAGEVRQPKAKSKPAKPRAKKESAPVTPEVADGWSAFPAEMGGLAVPRSSMPQIATKDRGAMVQFLKGRGITHAQEDVLPGSLKPSQVEYSPAKVEKAKTFEGPNRSILISADDHVVDGHHQWLAAMEENPGEPYPVIRLNAPIQQLLIEVARFPSAGVSDAGATATTQPEATEEAPKATTPTQDAPDKQVEAKKAREMSALDRALAKIEAMREKAMELKRKASDKLKQAEEIEAKNKPAPTPEELAAEAMRENLKGLFSAPAQAKDAEYLAAVEAGDMESAQRMVDEAAKGAGYDTSLMFHGIGETIFNVFKTRSGAHYFTPLKALADAYSEMRGGSGSLGVYLNIKNPFRGFSSHLTESRVNELKAQGYDGAIGIIDQSDNLEETVVFSSEQIKSADPVTRDASGAVIPLSQRFNPASDSILFSAPAGQWQEADIPEDRIPGIMATTKLVFDAGIRTPEDFAAFMERTFPGGASRPYVAGIWQIMGGMKREMRTATVPDWQGIYAGIDAPVQTPATKAKKAPKLGNNPLEEYDLLDFLADNPIELPPADQQTGKGEYDQLKNSAISRYYRQFITKPVTQARGNATPDVRAQEAYDYKNQDGTPRPLISSPDADTLINAIESAIANRQQTRAEIKRRDRREQEMVAQMDRFNRDKADGGQPIDLNAVRAGDSIVLNGENMEIAEVQTDEDGYTTSITLRDHTKYGIQRIGPDELLLVDEYIPRPRVAPVTEDEFGLAAETEAEMQARLAREDQQRRLQERANRPLAGNAGEFGTPDLLDTTAGDMALFNQPLANPANAGDTQADDLLGSSNLERDQPDAGLADGGGRDGVQSGAGPVSGDGNQVDGSGEGSSDTGGRGAMPSDVPAALGGITGDPVVRQPEAGTGTGATRDPDSTGSSNPDANGVAVEPRTYEASGELVNVPAGSRSMGQSGEVVAIKAAVPSLTDEQAGDVAFIERRLANKPGVLITNGTGTGKTFSGLGAVKRMLDAGAKHILIVAPSDKIGSDWTATANRFFGISDISQLTDTQSNGLGNRVVVTTYANFGQNDSLVNRPWDAVVTDEAHYLGQNKDGTKTNAIDTLQALTLHPKGAIRFADMSLPKEVARLRIIAAIKPRERTEAQSDEMDAIRAKLEAKRLEFNERNAATPEAKRPKVVMLSATPFAYHFSLDYAEGYLFDYPPENKRTVGRYNHPSPRSQFYMENFGYRMRTGKLTQPENATATGILERRFAEKLMKDGAMSGRSLQVSQDYGRHFVLTESELGTKIDEIMDAIAKNDSFRPLGQFLAIGDYLERRYLLEALKARESVDRIKQHLKLGRKVVVFHDYKKGGATNPLSVSFDPGQTVSAYVGGRPTNINLSEALAALKRAVPHFDDTARKLNGLMSPIQLLQREFGDMELFNGDVPASQRREAVKKFNTSGSKTNLILVQRASGKEGISLHDTDGKHQRVFIDLGIPGRPTDAIQSEGRIYRHGVQSNAVIEYLTTGTSFERHTFAQTIAQRASTAENLAMGERARALLQSFASGYNDAEPMEPSNTQGTGGKTKDAATQNADPFKDAVALYYTNAKKTSRNKAAEGIDYFATPEPLGFKMVEWAGIRPGEKVLEPSAGHGAIARFFPDSTNRHAVEPSNELAGRLALNATDVQIHESRFEDYYVGNKFDVIVMNPPFGTAGKTAMDHVIKATQHLKNGGRIVALIPEGSSMEKRFDKWMDSDEAKGFYMVAEYGLPQSAFVRAGTSVKARVVVIDKTDAPERIGGTSRGRRDFQGDTVEKFFESLRDSTAPDRADVARLEKPSQTAEQEAAPMVRETLIPVPSIAKPNTFEPADTWHAKKGKPTYVAKIVRRLSTEEYAAAKALATKNSGYWSAYNKAGAIPGFQFDTAEDRDAFLSATLKGGGDSLASAPAPSMPQARAEAIVRNLTPKNNAGKLNPVEARDFAAAQAVLAQYEREQTNIGRSDGAIPPQRIGISGEPISGATQPRTAEELEAGRRATGNNQYSRNPQNDEILPSSPAPKPDQSALKDALAQMQPIARRALELAWSGKSVEEVAKEINLSVTAVGNLLRVSNGRLRFLLERNGAIKPNVRIEDGKVKATSGRPDLAGSGNAAFAAVDQRRMAPEEVTHAEMNELAGNLFAVDPVAAEKLVVRWMDSGGVDMNTDGMPDGVKAIINEARARTAAEMLMTAAAKLLVTEKALSGGDSLQTARLIDLYRTTGTEQARALGMRQDPHATPEERAAMYLSESLLTPPESLRNEIRRNPANKERILEQWSRQADAIKADLKAEGYDIDATFAEFRKEQKMAEDAVPAEVKIPLGRATGRVRKLVKAVLEGLTPREAAAKAGMTLEAARDAYNTFRGTVNDAGAQAAQRARDALLRSAPAADFAANIGLPEWAEDAVIDAPLIKTPKTEELRKQRTKKKAPGELDLKNPVAVVRAKRSIEQRKSGAFDMISEYWRASILSGPQTHVVNVVSGLAYGTYEATFKKLAAGAQADVARMFGMNPDAASLADMPAMIAGTLPAIKQAFTDSIRSWKTEQRLFDSYTRGQLDNIDAEGLFKEQFQPAMKGKFGTFMRSISFRAMGAADEFVKSFFTRIEVAAQARQIARTKNLKGQELANEIAYQMTPGSEAWVRALDQAKKITFQTEIGSQSGSIDKIDEVAKLISETKKGRYGTILKGMSHFVFPFVDTPTNIFKAGITMSPVGGVLALIDGARSLNQRRKGNKEAAAKLYNAARLFDDMTNQIVAWGMILAISELVKPGEDEDETPYITGTMAWRTTAPGEREIAYRTAPPQSIRIGDKWYSYKRLDPFASALAFTVDAIKQMQSGKPLDEAWGAIGLGMVRNMNDKTFLQGVSDLMNAINDPERFGTKWAVNIATGFVPNLIRQPIRTYDPTFRDSDLPNDMPFWQNLGTRVGYGVVSQLAPPAFDVWGREADKNTGTGGPLTDFALRLFSPVDLRETGNVDPLDIALLRYNMTAEEPFGITAPSREIRRKINGEEVNVSLTDAQREEMARKAGQAARLAIGSRFNGRDLTDDDAETIKATVLQAQRLYREIAFRQAMAAKQKEPVAP